MPKCKYCGKSGLFLSLSTNGLCGNCNSIVVIDIQNQARIYNDSISLIDKSENIDVVFTRIQLVKKILRDLLKYEEKEITTITPVPSYLINVFEKESDNFVGDAFLRAQKTLMVKVLNLKSTSAKIDNVNKFVEKIDEYLPKVRNQQIFIEIRKECESKLQSFESANAQNQIKNNKPKESLAKEVVRIKEIHPAKLLYIEKVSKENVGSLGGYRIKIDMFGEIASEYIEPGEPSVIYKDLPVSKPPNDEIVERPQYYPSFIALDPYQRWKYLNWLNNISDTIDIGYVFLYYYGLERNLLLGDFETSYQEILFLRKFHNNSKSFESYSYNALLFGSVYRNRFDIAKFVMENESRNGIDNIDLLFKYRFSQAITIEDLMTLAKKVKGVNLNYIKKIPEKYQAAMSLVLSDKFGSSDYPIHSLYEIQDIPRRQILTFANLSFPSSLREPHLPNFLEFQPFLIELSEIFSKAHTLVKEDLIRERLINE